MTWEKKHTGIKRKTPYLLQQRMPTVSFVYETKEMTEEELEKYIVRKDDEVTRILFAYEINAEGNMEWHKITKDMASKWKKDHEMIVTRAGS